MCPMRLCGEQRQIDNLSAQDSSFLPHRHIGLHIDYDIHDSASSPTGENK